MPFKKIVKETAEDNSHINDSKSAPLATAGLNDANVSTYETTPLNSDEQIRFDASAAKKTKEIEVNTENLVRSQHQKRKPTASSYGLSPPEAMEGPNEEVAKLVAAKIWNAVVYNEWFKFFSQESLQEAVNRATRHDYRMIMELYKIMSLDMATNLAVLTLVDIIIIADNSYSMRTEGNKDMTGKCIRTEDFMAEYESVYQAECLTSTDPRQIVNYNNISRWSLMEMLLEIAAFISTLFDDDGISVRFLNDDPRLFGTKLDGLTNPDDVRNIFKKIGPSGGTPTGECLFRVCHELVVPKAISGVMKKPVLIRILTDGQASDNVTAAIREIRAELAQTDYGSRACLFSFSQIGNDAAATAALAALDTDEDPKNADAGAGAIIDSTSNFEIEKKEYERAQQHKSTEERVEYTVGFHMVKENCGVIIASLDQSDEIRSGPVTSFFKRMGL